MSDVDIRCTIATMNIESTQRPEKGAYENGEEGIQTFLDQELPLFLNHPESGKKKKLIRALTLATVLAGTAVGCSQSEDGDAGNAQGYVVEEFDEQGSKNTYNPGRQQKYEQLAREQVAAIERRTQQTYEALQIAKEMGIDLYEKKEEGRLGFQVVRSNGKVVQINGMDVPQEIFDKFYSEKSVSKERRETTKKQLPPIISGGEPLESESY